MMIEITQEILDKIHTDSDVRDLADELGVSYRELDYALFNKDAEGTNCYNCKYVSNQKYCSNCSRIIIVKDYYESILESEGN